MERNQFYIWLTLKEQALYIICRRIECNNLTCDRQEDGNCVKACVSTQLMKSQFSAMPSNVLCLPYKSLNSNNYGDAVVGLLLCVQPCMWPMIHSLCYSYWRHYWRLGLHSLQLSYLQSEALLSILLLSHELKLDSGEFQLMWKHSYVWENFVLQKITLQIWRPS